MEWKCPKDGGLFNIALWSRKYSLFLASVLFLQSMSCWAIPALPIPVVRILVGLEKTANKKTVTIEGFDLVVSEATTNRKLLHKDRRASIPVDCKLGGVIEIDPFSRKSKVKTTEPIRIQSLGGFIRVGENQFRDDLYVYAFNGECMVVNHVDIEKYVAGLLNSEMSANWNLAALKAQAVAARTYAVYQMKESGSTRFRDLKPPFDLDSTVKDQVYEGAHQERYKALRAVRETQGQVLVFEGRPIKAFYHSTCGGFTENTENVWGVKYPYIRPVKCLFCSNSPTFNWTYSIPYSEIDSLLSRNGFLKGKLKLLRVTARNSVGRARTIEVFGTGGVTQIHAVKLRQLLGAVHLRSTEFTIFPSTTGLMTFAGTGSGHGVGMCQWGAKGMGDRGFTHEQILKHYYPQTQISKLY